MTKEKPRLPEQDATNTIRSLHLVLRHSQARALWADIRGVQRAEEDECVRLPRDVWSLAFSVPNYFEQFVLVNNILLLED